MLLPKGYDPNRLSYPYLFSFLTPPAWAAALAHHIQLFPEHPGRASWQRFVAIRNVLMIAEVITLAGFVGWMLLG